ncbi:hypothetical protein HDU67_008570 [Dinochytrium kinnereticum]|nr:hypothetical protein HDU67_008570 [Dinochytrium kinnereticum]
MGITPGYLRSIMAKERAETSRNVICQSCYRLKNYGQRMSEANIDYESVFNRIRINSETLIVAVADAVDLPWSLLDNISKYVGSKPCILAVNKIDALPNDFSLKKLEKWIKQETEKSGHPPWADIIFTSAVTGDGLIELSESISKCRAPGFSVNFVGRPNVGKSKLIKALVQLVGEDQASTISHLPGTTVATIPQPLSRLKNLFNLREGVDSKASIMDTPGIPDDRQAVTFLNEDELKLVIIGKKLKPKRFSLNPGRSLFLGGIARLDYLSGVGEAVLDVNTSIKLPLHECSTHDAAGLYSRRVGSTSRFLAPPLGQDRVKSFPKLVDVFHHEVTNSGKVPSPFEISLATIGWLHFVKCMAPSRFRVLAPKSLGEVEQPHKTTAAVDDQPRGEKAHITSVENAGDLPARIESLKSALGSLERSFKENLHIKRLQHQPQSVFLGDSSAIGGLSGESDSAEDLISKAKGELARIELSRAKVAELKNQKDLEEAKILKQKIEETRANFRHKQALAEGVIDEIGVANITKAGPKFKRNFYSFFGEVKHVEMVDDGQCFAVFSNNGTIEIWECGNDYSDARILSIINLELGPLCIASKIFEENLGPNSKSFIPETTDDARVAVNPDLYPVFEGLESNSYSQESLESFTDLRPADSRASELSLVHGFFVGFESGDGCILELHYMRSTDGVNKVSHTIANKRKLSVTPVNHLCVVEFDNVVASLVSFTGTDLYIAAYTADLEDVWQCKLEYLKLTAKDRQNRTIPQGKLEMPEALTNRISSNQLDDSITAMCADRFRRQILVALRSGNVVSIEYGQQMLSGKFDSKSREDDSLPKRSKTPSLTSPNVNSPKAGDSPTIQKDVFISFCLEAFTLDALDAQQLESEKFERDKLAKKDALSRPPDEKPISKIETQAKMSTLMPITHIEAFVNSKTHLPGILIGCADGTLRTHKIENGFVAPRPILIQLIDEGDTYKEESKYTLTKRSNCWIRGSFLDLEDIQFIFSYTSDGGFDL